MTRRIWPWDTTRTCAIRSFPPPGSWGEGLGTHVTPHSHTYVLRNGTHLFQSGPIVDGNGAEDTRLAKIIR